MTQEQKARAYDEAIEHAKTLYENANGMILKKWVEQIFPELKESEDERVRKNLIGYINGISKYEVCEETKDSWIAWLEKQGKEEYALKSSKHEDILKFMQYIENRAKAYEFNLPNRGYDIYAFAKDILIWLEKQSEKKLIDKVEPKFHEGEWIIDDQGIVRQIERVIENVTNHTFGYDLVGGDYFNEEYDVRLWTIQDAKDGDILVSNTNQPFIYNGNYNAVSVGAYCGILCDGSMFIEATDACQWTSNNNIKPAAKEQCNTLFQKMKDTGYKWFADKKELRRIEL